MATSESTSTSTATATATAASPPPSLCFATVHKLRGSHHAVGVQLGKLSKAVMPEFLAQSSTWQSLVAKREVYEPMAAKLAEATKNKFPWIWDEVVGLAEGLEMTVDDVFL